MVLQSLTSIIYDLTAQSWLVASVIVKYYLAATAIYLYSEKGLTKENFTEKLLKDSRFVLTGVAGAGVVLYLTEIGFISPLKLFSELIALAYLGYLFWKY